jgi:hypothetical protein
MKTRTWRLTLGVLLGVLALAACSRHGAGSAGSGAPGSGPSFGGSTQTKRQVARGIVIGPNKSFAKITYQPAVKFIDREGFRKSLVAMSPDGRVFVFHDAPADIHALKGGDVLLIKNEFARKVLGAADNGGDTYVVTDRAMIGDLVKEGEINIDAPLTFIRAPAAMLLPTRPAAPDLLGLLVPSAYAQASPEGVIAQKAQEEGTKEAVKQALTAILISGWTVTQYQAATDGDQLNYSLVLVKNISGFVGKVAASGFVNNFRFWSNMRVKSGMLATIRTGLDNLQGKLHFDWEVAKGTPGSWDLADPVKLPGAVSIPLAEFLEGLPVTLEISSAILIHPALTGGNQIQTGGFTITVSGGMSGSISSGGAVPEGSSIDQTFQITNDSGLSAVAPDAMVIAYAAPRFELQVALFGPFNWVETLQQAVDNYEKYSGYASTLINQYSAGFKETWEKLQGPLLQQVSNVLKSNADVYAQLVSTEGVVHSPAISMVPCSKKWIEFSVQVGTAAQLFGLTPNAKASTTLYTKKYSKADPPSNFCEKVGT